MRQPSVVALFNLWEFKRRLSSQKVYKKIQKKGLIKIMKKLLTAVLSIILTFTFSTGIVFASEIEQKALYEITKYQIITGDPDGNLRLDDNITHAEAATIICRTFGLTLDNYNNEFADVSNNFWAAPYIAAAYASGLIDITETKVFNPDEFITSNELIKMFITALGYKPFADANGGYPSGYFIAASRYSLLNNISSMVMGSPITRKDTMLLTYAALDIPMMIQTGFDVDDNGIQYIIADGKDNTPLKTPRTILEEKLSK